MNVGPYYPFFRGKQNELVVIRERAESLSASGMVPIIEPVRSSFGSLLKALRRLQVSNGRAIIVTNPNVGSLSRLFPNPEIELLIEQCTNSNLPVGLALLATPSTPQTLITNFLDDTQTTPKYIVHAGARLDPQIIPSDEVGHIFLNRHFSRSYPTLFNSKEKVHIKNSFEKKNNKDYKEDEFFSDLHSTYSLDGFTGFGDFTIAGDSYSDTGGPAYAVAIHLTYIDPERDGEMWIRHFVSDRNNSPTDPAGKFAEALEKLVRLVEADESKLPRTDAIMEFLNLHKRQHFPGLGYVKKLSMQHHLEVIATLR